MTSASRSLRFFAAHSLILALLVLVALLSIALWKASVQTSLYLNRTRSPAPFSDSAILDSVYSSSSSSSSLSPSTSDALPASDYSTEGIVSATQAANSLFSSSNSFQLTQAFGIPMLVVVSPNRHVFFPSASSSSSAIPSGQQIQNFLGNLNVTVWWAVVEACMAKYSNSRIIVRSGFGDPSMTQFFPKLTGLDNTTANVFLWLMRAETDEGDDGRRRRSTLGSSVNVDVENNVIRRQIKEQCLIPGGNAKPIPEVENIEVYDIHEALERTRFSVAYRWPCSLVIAMLTTILFVSFAATKTIIESEAKATLISLLRTNSASTSQTEENIRSSQAQHQNQRNNCWWCDDLILDVASRRASAKSVLQNLMDRWKNIHSTMTMTMTMVNASDQQGNTHSSNNNNNNNNNNKNRDSGATEGMNRDNDGGSTNNKNNNDSSNSNNLYDLQQPLLLPPTAPPSLQPSSWRKSIIFLFVFSWFVIISGVVPFLMSIAALELVFAIKGTEEYRKQAASPYFGIILLLVSVVPFSIIHMIHALKVVDALYVRDVHAEFCAFLKQESVWSWFWFGPKGYWISAHPPSSSFPKDVRRQPQQQLSSPSDNSRNNNKNIKNSNNNRNHSHGNNDWSAANDGNGRPLARESFAINSEHGTSSDGRGGSGGRGRDVNSSQLTSSSYHNMYTTDTVYGSDRRRYQSYGTFGGGGGVGSVGVVVAENEDDDSSIGGNDSFGVGGNGQQQQQQLQRQQQQVVAPPNSRIVSEIHDQNDDDEEDHLHHAHSHHHQHQAGAAEFRAAEREIRTSGAASRQQGAESTNETIERKNDDDDDDSGQEQLPCMDQAILFVSNVVGFILLPIILCARAILHCPIRQAEKSSRRFLGPVFVSAFLAMCAAGAVLVAEATYALIGACVLACASFLLVTFGIVLPVCSCAFLGSLMILANWFRSALVDPICDVDDLEVEEMFLLLVSPRESSVVVDVGVGVGGRQQQQQQQRQSLPGEHHREQGSFNNVNSRAKDFTFEHPSTVHAAYIAYRKELEDFELLEKQQRLTIIPSASPIFSVNDGQLPIGNFAEFSSSSAPTSASSPRVDNNNNNSNDDDNNNDYGNRGESKAINRNCASPSRFLLLIAKIKSCTKLLANLSQNKGNRRKLLTLRWVILVGLMLVPFVLSILMFTQLHLDSCGWEHFLPKDRDHLRRELLKDDRSRYILPYSTVFDFCATGAVATEPFFSEVSSAHFAVAQKFAAAAEGGGASASSSSAPSPSSSSSSSSSSSLVNYFMWDVTRNNHNGQTYNADDAVILEIFFSAYRYLNSVLLSADKSASLTITIPNFDPFGSVVGGQHDTFVQKVRQALFSVGGAPLPPSPACSSVKGGNADFLAGVTGGSAPQIVEIQSSRYCCRLFWPVLVGVVVVILFFILSRNDFKIISVLRHKALRIKLTKGKNCKKANNNHNSNNKRNGAENNNHNTKQQSQQQVPETQSRKPAMFSPSNDDDENNDESYSDGQSDSDFSNNSNIRDNNARRISASFSSFSSSGLGNSNSRSRRSPPRRRRGGGDKDDVTDDETDDEYDGQNNNNNSDNDDNNNSRQQQQRQQQGTYSRRAIDDAAASQAFIARMKSTFLVCFFVCFNTGIATAVGMAAATVHAAFFAPGCKALGPEFLSSSSSSSSSSSPIFSDESISLAKEGDPLSRLSLEIFRTTFFPGIAIVLLLLELADFWCYVMLPFQNRNVDVEKLLSLMEQYARTKAEIEISQSLTLAGGNTAARNAMMMMTIPASASVASTTPTRPGTAGFFNYQQYLQYATTTTTSPRIAPNNNNVSYGNGSGGAVMFFGRSDSFGSGINTNNNNNNHCNGDGTSSNSGNDSIRGSQIVNNNSNNNNNNSNDNSDRFPSNQSFRSSSSSRGAGRLFSFFGVPAVPSSAINIAGRAAAVEACGANSLGCLGSYFTFALACISIIFWIVLGGGSSSSAGADESPMVAEFWFAVGFACLWKSIILNLLVHPAQRHWSLNLSLFAASSSGAS